MVDVNLRFACGKRLTEPSAAITLIADQFASAEMMLNIKAATLQSLV